MSNFQNPAKLPTITENTAKQVTKLNSIIDQYRAWQEEVKTKTLQSYWDDAKIQSIVSASGYPALVMGEGRTTNIALDVWAALRFFRSLPKYWKLEWHEHISVFNPARRISHDVRVTWENGKFVFWSFQNGDYILSMLNDVEYMRRVYGDPNSSKFNPTFLTEMLNKRSRMIKKHAEIEAVLESKSLKDCRFMVVMTTAEQQDYYHREIEPWLSQPYINRLNEEIKLNEEHDMENMVENPPVSEKFHLKPVDKVRKVTNTFVETLLQSPAPVTVYYETLTSTTTHSKIFDPKQPDRNDSGYISAETILSVGGAFKFRTTPEGKERAESKGKEAK